MAVYDAVNPPGRLADVAGRYTQFAGAAVSLSLMIGVAVWGTKTILRDVSGVPVVRAMQGEMRVAPADPGGEVANHNGLAVNAVAAVGVAAAPEDTLTLAPRTFDLAAEDLDTAPLTDMVTADPAAPADVATGTDAAPMTAPTGPMNADDILALADQISAGVSPITALDDSDADPLADDEAIITFDNIDAADPIAAALAEAMASDIEAPAATATDTTAGLRRVMRPVARRADVIPAVATAADLVPAAVTVAAVTDPGAGAAAPVLPSAAVLTDELPVGTKLVQLGAFPTPEEAATAWTTLSGRFGAVMNNKAQVIQQASSGGATFYRLRASGFDTLDDTKQFCETLDAGRAACIPVVVR